jgi:hypothetical protein
MKTDGSPLVVSLIEALRRELQEYGEMLALLDQQQGTVLTRAAEEVFQSVGLVQIQLARIGAARQKRENCQKEIAARLGRPEEANFVTLIPRLPDQFRLAVESLVRENNQLLSRVQERLRQNHLLLARSLQLMQQFLKALLPVESTTMDNEGSHLSPVSGIKGLYDAVG